MASCNLSEAPLFNQTLYEPGELSKDEDAAAQDHISKEKEKLAQGIVGRNFYQDIKQDLDKPSEDDRVPIMSGPVISSFQDAV